LGWGVATGDDAVNWNIAILDVIEASGARLEKVQRTAIVVKISSGGKKGEP